MTFENVIENTNNANVNESLHEVPVKVFYGAEIRRATFKGNTYASLFELAAKLFGLEQANIVVKYQDEDGDKITISSDGELQEAMRLFTAKVPSLRFFVETKPVAQEQEG
jgi:PB1 domain